MNGTWLYRAESFTSMVAFLLGKVARRGAPVTVAFMVLLWPVSARAQQPDDPDPSASAGARPYDLALGGDVDRIDATTGALTVNIPIISYPQRADDLGLAFALHYEDQGNYFTCSGTRCTERLARYAGFAIVNRHNLFVIGDDVADANGGRHRLVSIVGTKKWLSDDGSGFAYDNQAGVLTTATGVRVWRPNWCNVHNDSDPSPSAQYGPAYIGCEAPRREDRSGNRIEFSPSRGWTDTMGRQIPVPVSSSAGCPAGPRAVTEKKTWTLPGPNGGTYPIVLCYVSVDLLLSGPRIHNFYPTDRHVTTTQPQSVILPNGQYWQLEYDATLGRLKKITYPAGASIEYTWTDLRGVGYSTTPVVTSRAVSPADGTGEIATWHYAVTPFAGGRQMVITDPHGNDTVTTATTLPGTSYYVPQRTEVYEGSGGARVLRHTTIRDYVYQVCRYLVDPSPPRQYNVRVVGVFLARETSGWPNGMQRKTELVYDNGAGQRFDLCLDGPSCTWPFSYGRVVERLDSDYGVGAPGPLMRTQIFKYLAFAPAKDKKVYLDNNLLNLLSATWVTDANDDIVGRTDYRYDAEAPYASGITTMHNSVPPSGVYLGNLTDVYNTLQTTSVAATATCPVTVSTGGAVSTQYSYYDTGTIRSVIDPCGQQTTMLTYSQTYAGAYPTTVANALNQATTLTYDYNTGAVSSRTDENGRVTTKSYQDPFGRVTQIATPDGGLVSFCYSDVPGAACFATGPGRKVVKTTSGRIVKATETDGLGRVVRTRLESNPGGATTTRVSYDLLSRVRFAWNPTRCADPATNCGEPTWGFVEYDYDALGRIRTVVDQDGSRRTSQYLGNCAIATDEAGRSTKSCTDGLGRISDIYEDPAGLNYWTRFGYDPAGNVTTVVQRGGSNASGDWRVRRFAYELMSRLTSSTTPEAGTVTYTYDAAGKVVARTAPRPNQTGSLTVTTSFAYDVLGRLAGKTYSDGTPAVTYAYDGASLDCAVPVYKLPGGPAANNQIGQRSAMCDASGSTAWAYDAVGRITSENQRRLAASSFIDHTVGYHYYDTGRLATVGFSDGHGPATRTIMFGRDGADRVTSVYGGNVVFLESATYDALGGLFAGGRGLKHNSNGSSEYVAHFVNGLNNRGQLTDQIATADGVDLFRLWYDYHKGAGNNGNLFRVVDFVDTKRSETFEYDPLNRIWKAFTEGPDWGQVFSIDAWGNLVGQAPYPGKVAGETLNTRASARNQIAALQYDAAGNVTNDGTHTYVYDAENRLISIDGDAATNVYNGDGRRVKRCFSSCTSGVLYWLAGTEVLAETDLRGEWTAVYAMLGGRPLGRVDYPSGNISYYFANRLGSTTLIIDKDGKVTKKAEYYPYGTERVALGAGANRYQFTGKERDQETGLSYFGARFLDSSRGRFMTADPLSTLAPSPDPQTMNGYAYTRNNPLRYIDPVGLQGVPPRLQDVPSMTVIGHTPAPISADFWLPRGGPGVWADPRNDAERRRDKMDEDKREQQERARLEKALYDAYISPIGAIGVGVLGDMLASIAEGLVLTLSFSPAFAVGEYTTGFAAGVGGGALNVDLPDLAVTVPPFFVGWSHGQAAFNIGQAAVNIGQAAAVNIGDMASQIGSGFMNPLPPTRRWVPYP